jgi:tRNA A-37 threonylcarbamoyl transferase component Bud32
VPAQADTVGRYQLRATLGAGGFAIVYHAYDPLLVRDIALKVLQPHPARDAAVRARFLREGRALARVRHPNVVTVYEGGEDDTGRAYLAMELVDGRTLGAVLAERGPLPLTGTLTVVEQIARALDAVRAAGLVHRDVKPDNIMLEHGSGRVVLLDLGIAHALDLPAVTAADRVVGTPALMAPEQVTAGGQVTPRTDVYQLGASAYAMLAGRAPFEGTPAAVLDAVANRAPPDLGALRPDLPRAVVEAVAQAMAKDPARRPASAGAFAARLRTAATAVQTDDAPAVGPPPEPRAAAHGVPTLPPRAPAGVGTRSWAPAPHLGDTALRPGVPEPPPVAGEPPTIRLPEHTPPAGRTLPIRRRRWRAAVVLLVGVAALVGAAFTLRADAGRLLPGGTATGRQDGTSAPATVTDLRVSDNETDRRQGPLVVGESVAACFTLSPGVGGRTLDVVLTSDGVTPAGAGDPAVVGRAGPVPRRAGEGCYAVRVIRPPLAPGRYRVTVLDGGQALADASFTARARPGDVVVRENFDTAGAGLLRTDFFDPAQVTVTVEGGELVIRQLDPRPRSTPAVPLVGTYDDATIAVDARLEGETAGRYVAVGCRGGSDRGYAFLVEPALGRFALLRFDGGAQTALAAFQESDAVRRGNATNRLELTCAGGTITAALNGVTLATVEDGTHAAGFLWLQGNAFGNTPATAEARFDHLLVTQR